MKKILLLIALICPVFAWAAKPAVPEIIPAPTHIEMTKGTFNFKGVAINCDPAILPDALRAVRQLADRLTLVSGKLSEVASPVGLRKAVEKGKLKGLYFIQDDSIAPEGYTISITPQAAIVKAADYNGFFYSLQTIRQLLPVAIYSRSRGKVARALLRDRGRPALLLPRRAAGLLPPLLQRGRGEEGAGHHVRL